MTINSLFATILQEPAAPETAAQAAKPMNPLISFFRRKILRLPADRWDYQYDQGEWEGLPEESARIEAVIGIIASRFSSPRILEVGCGKAVMLRHMPPGSFRSFTGIDISKVAIAASQLFETERVRFLLADMHSFTPGEQYDVIAFNESLYYARDPAAVFARYLPFLRDGGCLIVSAFQNKYTAGLWPALDRQLAPVNVVEVSDRDHVWKIKLYQHAKESQTNA